MNESGTVASAQVKKEIAIWQPCRGRRSESGQKVDREISTGPEPTGKSGDFLCFAWFNLSIVKRACSPLL
jgi:hypothetical protein